jgi:hypothetical protein
MTTERENLNWRSPTPEMLNGDPLFDAIWNVIKSWDVNVPGVYIGYCGANGNHARAIYEAVAGFRAPAASEDDARREADRLRAVLAMCHKVAAKKLPDFPLPMSAMNDTEHAIASIACIGAGNLMSIHEWTSAALASEAREP